MENFDLIDFQNAVEGVSRTCVANCPALIPSEIGVWVVVVFALTLIVLAVRRYQKRTSS